MKTVFVSGGAGFIGSNFIRHVLRNRPDWNVLNYDKLTYAGNLENLQGIDGAPRYEFVRGDVCDRNSLRAAIGRREIDSIVHFAAESHVDRSIIGPDVFVRTNVVGTQTLLDVARELSIHRFLQVSTDEVYGSLGPSGRFTETTPLHPNSPYAASKASSDLLALAYYHTFRLPVLIARCSNNYGPYQFPEKLIPLMIINAINGKSLPVYGDGLNIRDWLFVDDHCSALITIIEKGMVGEVYNIGGNNEWKNIDVVRRILEILGKGEDLIEFVNDRPGHDKRYAMDASKIMQGLGWEPSYPFERGLLETVEWYRKNRVWWERVMSGEYLEYYREVYDNR